MTTSDDKTEEARRAIAAFTASARESRERRAEAASALLKALTVMVKAYREAARDPVVVDSAIAAIAKAKAAGITMEGLT